jgi:predicted dehydrogenase
MAINRGRLPDAAMSAQSLPEVRIAVIGYGTMGRAHSYAYHVAPVLRELPCRPRLVVLGGRNAAAVERAARSYGFAEWATDWRQVVARDDVDLVDICTPPGTHAAIAGEAARAGKAILCEKPLAINYAEARDLARRVAEAGVLNAVGFNYRRLPAVALLERMVREGRIGEVRLWRGTWLSDEFVDPAISFDWRFERGSGGTTIADLGAHLIDLARATAGEVEAVVAQSATFVPRRADPSGGAPREVTIDDASAALLRFASGARGTLEVARSCVRRPVDFTVELNGSTGTLVFDYTRLNELRYGTESDDPGLYGMRRIRAEHPTHPYARAWWPIGQGVGYGSSFVNQIADLLETWSTGPWYPDFADAARTQAVCEAIEQSAAIGRWVAVREIEGADS